MKNNKRPIYTSKAPQPIGPYSQGMRVGGWLICSGQIPLDPQTSQVVGQNVTQQTRQVLENVKSVLHSEQMDLKDVVKTLIFLTDLKQFSSFNEVYATYFSDHKPARSCVEVSALPKDVLVEVEVWAYKEEK